MAASRKTSSGYEPAAPAPSDQASARAPGGRMAAVRAHEHALAPSEPAPANSHQYNCPIG